jgi:phosphoribosylglycinamide formyltransferase-1
MKCCLITYEVPHLKTQQVFFNLIRMGLQKDLSLMFAPFTERKKRQVVLAHRPEQFLGADPNRLATTYGIRTYALDDWRIALQNEDIFIICGSNLLPDDFAATGRVLNAHPGLLMQSRGLDSFKWAIFEGKQVGVTLHFIDANVDAGVVVHTEPTPVFIEDSMETFAQRHYEAEIDIISNFKRYIESSDSPTIYTQANAHMRMSNAKEREMMSHFDQYKIQFAVP